MGMCGPEEPLHASPLAHKGPTSSKSVSSQELLLRKFGNFNLYSFNFCLNFSSRASKSGNSQLTSPQILEIFSSLKAPSSRGKYLSSQVLHFGNPSRTSLTEKELSAPHRKQPCFRAPKSSQIVPTTHPGPCTP